MKNDAYNDDDEEDDDDDEEDDDDDDGEPFDGDNAKLELAKSISM